VIDLSQSPRHGVFRFCFLFCEINKFIPKSAMSAFGGLDVGLGTPVIFSRSDHQGVHKVWGTQLDETGHYQPIDLQ